MRLICPNCGAQYEVPDDVVPEGGRDVQCSNCGHTWFEHPGASAAAEDEFAPPPAEPRVAPPEPEVPGPAPAEPAAPADSVEAPVAAPEETPAAPEPPATDPAAQPRPALDASIAEILREEAAREEAARAAEAQTGLQSQGDLGLDDSPPAVDPAEAEATQERIARLKGDEAGAGDSMSAAVAATVAASRKELLPDIEEINSTLRSDEERGVQDHTPEEMEREQRRGFRRGFLTVLLIIIVLCLIYLFADQIAAQVPALAGILNGYVAAVDNLRIWLDIQIQNLLAQLEGSDAAITDGTPPAEPVAPDPGPDTAEDS